MNKEYRCSVCYSTDPIHKKGCPTLKTKKGIKFDTEKNRVDLLPVDALEAISEVLTYGANKYADRNWEKGMAWSRVYGALLRHLWAWFRGEEKDPESGHHHLHHVGCCVLFLISYNLRKVGEDDRPKNV